VPIVVVSSDPDGAVAAALAGAPVTFAEPAPHEAGPGGQIGRGIEVAREQVAETTAALVWPARIVWAGPETVTSLIEAHGTDRDAILYPVYDGENGFPVLVPLEHLDRLGNVAVDQVPDAVLRDLSTADVPSRSLALGDPGVTHDRSIARADLPPYAGPVEPPAGHVHEWGAAVADLPDDSPLEGPALAPYGQAVATDPEQPG
jgi:CTP:molybdopterin cytidylyltransferase MocA